MRALVETFLLQDQFHPFGNVYLDVALDFPKKEKSRQLVRIVDHLPEIINRIRGASLFLVVAAQEIPYQTVA
jgi:hypothetical protein